jgi:hypothetical protein
VNFGGYFLITANHVFENKTIDEIIIFTGPGTIVRLYCDLGFYLPVAGNDNIDLAVLQLPEPLLLDLQKRYNFLHHKNIALSGISPEVKEFMLYGFIANQTKPKSRSFESNQFGMLTVRKDIPINHPSGFTERENIWLSYNRRKQSFLDSNFRNIGPKDLRGLSGGPVWAVFGSKKKPEQRICILAGIMIEQRIDKGYIIASKIHMLANILQLRFGIGQNSLFT